MVRFSHGIWECQFPSELTDARNFKSVEESRVLRDAASEKHTSIVLNRVQS